MGRGSSTRSGSLRWRRRSDNDEEKSCEKSRRDDALRGSVQTSAAIRDDADLCSMSRSMSLWREAHTTSEEDARIRGTAQGC